MRGRLEYNDAGQMVMVHEESAAHAHGIAEICKGLQNAGMTGTKDMKHLAEFPGFLIQAYCDRVGIEWAEWFQNPVHARVMLNDPDLAYFRIDAGRV